MKKRSVMAALFSILLVLVTGGAVLLSPVEVSAQAPRYKSGKPLCAKVALNKDGSKALAVIFDESKGTGTGYDVLYADVGPSGKFDRAQTVRATVRKCSSGVHCYFPAIKLNVPHANKAMGAAYPCELTFNYQKHSYRTGTTGRLLRLASANPTTTREEFAASAKIQLRQGSAPWEYSFTGNIKPSQSFENAPVWSFLRTPRIDIATRPDAQKKGNMGIGLTLAVEGVQMQCKKGGPAINAHVEIKRPDGRVVHRDDAPLDKFRFG